MQTQTNLDADLRAIEAINQRDVQFALANDLAGMMSQWTDDIVLLPAAGPIQRGRNAIAEALRGVETRFEVLDGGSTFRKSRFSATMPSNGGRTTKACVRAQVARRSVAAAS